MGRRKELSVEERAEIISLKGNTSMSMRAIALKVGCTASCVKKTLDRYSEIKNLQDRPRSGNPKIDDHQRQALCYADRKTRPFQNLPCCDRRIQLRKRECGKRFPHPNFKNFKETVV